MPDRDEIFVLDDDPSFGDLLAHVLHRDGYRVSCFKDAEPFMRAARSRTPACILLDIFAPRRSGLEVLKDFDARGYAAPVVVMSGRADIPLVVEAMKLGAFDVIEKPFDPDAFAMRLDEMIAAWRREVERNTAKFPGSRLLTPRERQVLIEIAVASSNKEAAAHLGLSPRTVEVHRAHIMMKLGAKRTAISFAWS